MTIKQNVLVKKLPKTLSGMKNIKPMKKEGMLSEESRQGRDMLSTATTLGLEENANSISATAVRLKLSKLACAAKLHGAKVVKFMSSEVTHIVAVLSTDSSTGDNGGVGIGSHIRGTAGYGSSGGGGGGGHIASIAALSSSPSPGTLLRIVQDQAGGSSAVRSLEMSLQDGLVHLVTSEWLEDSIAMVGQHHQDPTSIAAAGDGTNSLLSSGKNFKIEDLQSMVADPVDYSLMDVDSMQTITSWPWDEFIPASDRHQHGHGRVGRPSSATLATATRKKATAHNGPQPGDIIHVPAPRRRGTALKKAPVQRRGTRAAARGGTIGDESSEGGEITNMTTISEADTVGNAGITNIGSIANFPLEEVPLVESKPVAVGRKPGPKGTARKTRVSKKLGAAAPQPVGEPPEEKLGIKSTAGGSNTQAGRKKELPGSSAAVPAPTAAAAAAEEDDDEEGMHSFLDIMASMPMTTRETTIANNSKSGGLAIGGIGGNLSSLVVPLPVILPDAVGAEPTLPPAATAGFPGIGRGGGAGDQGRVVTGGGSDVPSHMVPMPSSLDDMMITNKRPLLLGETSRGVVEESTGTGIGGSSDGGGGGSRVGAAGQGGIGASPQPRPKMSLRERHKMMLAQKKPNE